MPSNIVIVNDDPAFLGELEAALRATGDEVRSYPSVVSALVGLEEQPAPDLLITPMRFAPGGSNGVALGLMARRRSPKIEVLFIGPPEFEDDAADLGTFLATPVGIPEILDAVARLRRS